MSRTVALALALVLLAGVAHAQPRDVAKADALFKEGRALMKKGDYETACPKLEESYRLDPAAGTGINLGDCFEKQSKVASALLAYQAARALLKAGDPRIGPVDKEIAALDKRAPRLTIKLAPGAPEGTTVKRDGREVEASKLGVPVAVNPGKLKVVVSATGHIRRSFHATLREGQSQELAVAVGDTVASEAPARAVREPTDATRNAVPSPRDNSQRTVGLIVGGVGLGALGVGGVFWLVANSKEQDAKAAGCSEGSCSNDRAKTLSDEGDQARLGANWSAGAGVVLLAAGVVIVLTSPSDTEPVAGFRIAPRAMVGGAGAQVGGVW